MRRGKIRDTYTTAPITMGNDRNLLRKNISRAEREREIYTCSVVCFRVQDQFEFFWAAFLGPLIMGLKIDFAAPEKMWSGLTLA